jgi:uncharacterized protein
MTCPRCHTADLDEKDRQGVKIDVCPSCRGVWLDRGELEKLIARSRGDDDDDDRDRRPRYGDDDDDDRHRGHRRRSWWDIFD